MLAGHSTGGTYALNYAAQYPQQVGGVALIDSATHISSIFLLEDERFASITTRAITDVVRATCSGQPLR